MKAGKTSGPSGIVVEMIRAAGDMGASMICDLAAAIICDGKVHVPSDWEQSFIVCLYTRKGDALERGNYRGLKLTEQVMKILERTVDGLIRQLVSIYDSQFGFVSGRGTTDAIFVVRQLQENYGTARLLDGRPQKEVQVGTDKLEVVASFCYLGDMLSAAGGCELSTTTRENRLEEVQGSATSSLFMPPLFQNTWPCVQLLCAECNAPCQWDLAIDKAKPPAPAAKRQGNDQTESAMSGCKTLSPPGPVSYLRGLTLRIWTSFWRREDLDGMDMWNAPTVQSRQPLTYRLMESMGLGGPRWHGSSWQRGIAESGSSRLSTLMIDIPGDLVWDLPCVQQVSYLEGGPIDVDVAPVPAR